MLSEKPMSGGEIAEHLEKQIEIGQDFLHKMEYLLPMFMGGLQFGSSKEKLHEAMEPTTRLIRAFLAIRQGLDELSQKDSDDIIQALKVCSGKLEAIAHRLSGEDK